MTNQLNKLLFPITGMLVGMAFGVLFGSVAVWYFDVQTLLNQVCLIGSCLIVFQLFGATVGSTVGKLPE